MAQSEIENYMSDLDNIKDKWVKHINDYHIAYETAHTNFQKALNKQKLHNDLLFDIAFAGLSIVGGAMLMRAFGAATLSGSAKEIALEALCKKELNRALEAARIAKKYATQGFVLGRMLDDSAKSAKGQLIAKAKSSWAAMTAPPDMSPARLKSKMMSYILDVKTKAHDFAAAVRDSSIIPDDEKDRIAANLRKAEFFRVPRRIDDGKLAKRLELAIHINYVSTADTLVTHDWVHYWDGRPPETRDYVRRQIPVPQSRYPKKPNKSGHELVWRKGPLGSKIPVGVRIWTVHVDFRQTGSKIRDAANKVSRELGFGVLYAGSTGRDELVRAERISRQLADQQASLLRNAMP